MSKPFLLQSKSKHFEVCQVGTNNTNWPINIEALEILPQQVN